MSKYTIVNNQEGLWSFRGTSIPPDSVLVCVYLLSTLPSEVSDPSGVPQFHQIKYYFVDIYPLLFHQRCHQRGTSIPPGLVFFVDIYPLLFHQRCHGSFRGTSIPPGLVLVCGCLPSTLSSEVSWILQGYLNSIRFSISLWISTLHSSIRGVMDPPGVPNFHQIQY